MIMLSGCGLSPSTAERAQRLADDIYPGQLYVIDAELQPGTIGFPETWVTYGFVDDSDAAARVVGLSEDRLRPAVERARQEAAELGALRSAFGAQQLELVTVGRLDTTSGSFQGAITLAAEITSPTIAALDDGLDAALGRWVELRGSPDFPGLTQPVGSLSIGFVDPDDVAALPELADDRLPGLLQLSYPERQWAVDQVRSHSLFTLDPAGRPYPAAAALTPVLSEAESSRLDATVRPLAAASLQTRRLDLHLARSLTWSRLEPASVTALRTYALACPEADGCNPARATHAVAVTVDLTTWTTSDLRLLTPTRTASGGWQQPLEPERL